MILLLRIQVPQPDPQQYQSAAGTLDLSDALERVTHCLIKRGNFIARITNLSGLDQGAAPLQFREFFLRVPDCLGQGIKPQVAQPPPPDSASEKPRGRCRAGNDFPVFDVIIEFFGLRLKTAFPKRCLRFPIAPK